MPRKLSIKEFRSDIAGLRKIIEAATSPFGDDSPAAKRTRRRAALSDIVVFGESYFPHYLTCPSSELHRFLAERLQALLNEARDAGKGGQQAVAAPRGSAKSTWVSLIAPLWCVAGKRRNFIGLFSDTTSQANDFLEIVKLELESNQRLAQDFPEICGEGPVWQVGDVLTANGVRIKAWGSGKRLRGARHGQHRPDLIIVDDPENDENVVSAEQREKTRKWFFRALRRAGQPDTVTLVVGTIIHHDCLIANLLKNPAWNGRKFRAVIAWSQSPRWEEWEHIYTDQEREDREQAADAYFERHKAVMLTGAEVLWPERYSYYDLVKMRVMDGPAHFDSEMQNEPLDPESAVFLEEWLKYYEDSELEGKELVAVAAVDPSMGKRSKRSDPSAVIVLGVARDAGVHGRAPIVCYVLDADIRKRHPDRIIQDVFVMHQVHRPLRIRVEETQFQEFFRDELVTRGQEQGLFLPVEGFRPLTDKLLRIQRLQPHVKNGVIRFSMKHKTLIQQLLNFPKGDHDDGPDALEMAFSLAEEIAGGAPEFVSIRKSRYSGMGRGAWM